MPAFQTYGSARIHIPKAPALGLLLEQPQFGVYNLKVREANLAADAVDAEAVIAAATIAPEAAPSSDFVAPEVPAPPTPKPRDSNRREFIDYEKHAEKIALFKEEMIYKRMRAEEAENHMCVSPRLALARAQCG